jgi:polysaccharide deacetylase 2 family uncharacterized protein YibQ
VSATPDQLPRPLGLDRPKATRSPARALGLLALTAAFGVIAYGAFLRGAPAPQPFAVAPIRTLPPEPPTAAPPAEPAAAAPAPRAAVPAPLPTPPAAGKPAATVAAKMATAPDLRLVERTRYGLLPRIGPDGARPHTVYARPTPPAARTGPRIALVVTGLGISQSLTAEALAKLPPEVTLAFAPYGSDLERMVTQVREKGHEVLLQVPMEPFDYPDNDPGPHTLTARAKPQENLDRLHWVMGRFTGYTGLVTLMGAKLTADEGALQPILREVSQRGLLLVDDGASVRSTIRTNPSPEAATLRAGIVVDAVVRGDAVDRELGRLEEAARSGGAVVGTAGLSPVTLERIAAWARTLPQRGIHLVPPSALLETPR